MTIPKSTEGLGKMRRKLHFLPGFPDFHRLQDCQGRRQRTPCWNCQAWDSHSLRRSHLLPGIRRPRRTTGSKDNMTLAIHHCGRQDAGEDHSCVGVIKYHRHPVCVHISPDRFVDGSKIVTFWKAIVSMVPVGISVTDSVDCYLQACRTKLPMVMSAGRAILLLNRIISNVDIFINAG